MLENFFKINDVVNRWRREERLKALQGTFLVFHKLNITKVLHYDFCKIFIILSFRKFKNIKNIDITKFLTNIFLLTFISMFYIAWKVVSDHWCGQNVMSRRKNESLTVIYFFFCFSRIGYHVGFGVVILRTMNYFIFQKT